VTIDATPPAVPVVNNVVSPTAFPVLTGTAVLGAGETLTVTVNGATYTVTPDAFGNWTVDTATDVPSSGALGPFVDLGVYPITATVTDLAGNTSNAGGTVTVLINDAPVVTTSGGALAYTENDPFSAVDPAVVVSDVDNPTLASATIQITGGYVAGEDLLTFTAVPGISGSFNGATGTLTLSATGATTMADWQSVLQSVAYQNSSDNPSVAPRTVTLIVNDGALDSLPATRTINVTAVNDAPTLTNNNLTLTDGATVTLTLANLGASDPDNAWGGLTYAASGVTNGQFELTSAPGTAITSFTQADVAAGLVVFVHAGNNLAPAYVIQASDGTLLSAPSAASISFTTSNSGLTAGDAPTGDTTDLGEITTTSSAGSGSTGSNLSGPTGLSGTTGVARGQETFEEIAEPAPAPAPVVSVDTRQAAAKAEPPKVTTETMTVQSSSPVIASAHQDFVPHFTQSRPHEIKVELGKVALAEAPREHFIQLDLNSIRMTSFALSIGAIWWATRATGLLASLLSSLPAWRNFDPLPVLGRNEDEEDEVQDAWAQAYDAQLDQESAKEEELLRKRFSNDESQPIELDKLQR